MTTSSLPRLGTLAVGGILAVTLPFWVGDFYQLHLAALIGVYWVLISGLNLVVGYTGQLSIGHVGLLSIGSYAFAILVGRYGVDPLLTLALAGGLGGLCGFLLGLPSLRLPGFYFAMATMAFALIMAELSLAQGDLTGGGAGLPVPGFAAPFDTPTGFYWLVLLVAALITWMTWNVARLMWGRGLIALRDSEVAAAAVGVPIFRLKLTVFTFSGVTAGIGGALFASLQSYITPETFVFELGLFFFVCIIIGGRGSILGPFVGTVVLTALPEMVAPLAKLGNFFYGLLLLAVVLVVPEGIGHVIKSVMARLQKKGPEPKGLQPDIGRLAAAVRRGMRQDIQRGHAS
ncbi:branched-chain amino acid ABC transporter permease [Azospirillum sp. TSH64]|uniref:branched-chain amino acid ABC transporter permease n=1 Tax=Azospirillum sp. TSH64 TaxID=652740 RepID=UPI000D61C6FE|nr:branched-chain amino acid ABC transporter permease [Azospirillum sp. TSH64]PWC74158.1 ABC transporter permease [Azospirillum sp. TSH64]